MALRNLSDGSAYVQVAGSESKQTIIFIHGLGGSSSNWDTVLRQSGLSDSYKTITFDLKGHGLSPLGASDKLAFDDYVRSVKDVLDSEKVDKAHVVGHSMGGLIATHFAAKWPQMVEKLVLVGGVKAFPDAGKQALQGRATKVFDEGMGAIADTVATAGTSKATQSSNPLAYSSVRASLISTSANGYGQACLALAAAPEPDYSKIAASTLILAGDEDKTCPEATVNFLAKEIKNTEVVKLSNVGHWHQIEDYKSVADNIVRFLK